MPDRDEGGLAREPVREPATDSASLTELLARSAQTGDLERFEELYARVAPSLFAWISLRLGAEMRRRLEPEEVAQESWCRALELFPNFDPARSSFRAWLHGIAKNVLFECLRRLHRADARPRGVIQVSSILSARPDSATNVTRRVARDEALQHFLDRVGLMGEEDRQLVIHCGLEGLSSEEAGERMGLKSGTVAKRWQRLRAELQERGGAGDLLAP